MPLALLFPGQGSQFVGMGKDLCEAFPEAKAVFDEADAALGFRISTICFEGPEEELKRTANTQPAILTHSIAALRVLEARRPERLAGAAAAAGHSLGEYSAGVAAGAFSFADAVRTVHDRGKFMQESVPEGVGAMAAILGLAADAVASACDDAAVETGKIVAPANYNSPEQTVIAGHAEAVARASELCRERGAKKAVPLPVSAPFHCALMQPAAERLLPVLRGLAIADPRLPVVTNVDAREATNSEEVRAALARQVASPVRWVESVERLGAMGVTEALEIGPGAVLAGLVRRIRKDIPVTPVGKADQIPA
ncbi:MAG TPA: ACP S-malonyltransferase [Thermoanaerobaculia bacterium]|nr:ACP S-malonyltransferase [Thermoanaerobaculia bacterium]